MLPADKERVKTRVVVVDIYTLGVLEAVDDGVRQGRGEDFVCGLDEPLADDSGDHGSKRYGPGEGEQDENERIEALTDEGRADGAAPEPASVRGDLHPGEYVGVGKFANEVGQEGGSQEARRVAENDLVGPLVLPERGGGEYASEVDGGDGQEVAEEAQPDHTPRRPVAVDLGQNVAADVADREHDHGRRQYETEHPDQLDRRDVPCDERRYEQGDDHHERIRVTHAPVRCRVPQVTCLRFRRVPVRQTQARRPADTVYTPQDRNE